MCNQHAYQKVDIKKKKGLYKQAQQETGAAELCYWERILAHKSLSALILGRKDILQLHLDPKLSGECWDLRVGAFHSCRILLSDWVLCSWKAACNLIKSRQDKFFRSGNNFNETMWCDLAGILAVRSRITLYICTFAGAGNAVPATFLYCLYCPVLPLLPECLCMGENQGWSKMRRTKKRF